MALSGRESVRGVTSEPCTTGSPRGAPFWRSNGRLERTRPVRQFDVLWQTGMGGAHLHPQTGLATPCLGDEFLDHLHAVAEEAGKRGMHAWLYDEDRWPSGFAGGLATAEKRYRLRHLRLSRTSGRALPHAPLLRPPQSGLSASTYSCGNGPHRSAVSVSRS